MELTLADIERLPKTDLHVHLDGSLRLSTMLELGAEQGVELPATTTEALGKALHCGQNAGSLVEYLKAFDTTLKVLQTAEKLVESLATLLAFVEKASLDFVERPDLFFEEQAMPGTWRVPSS